MLQIERIYGLLYESWIYGLAHRTSDDPLSSFTVLLYFHEIIADDLSNHHPCLLPDHLLMFLSKQHHYNIGFGVFIKKIRTRIILLKFEERSLTGMVEREGYLARLPLWYHVNVRNMVERHFSLYQNISLYTRCMAIGKGSQSQK